MSNQEENKKEINNPTLSDVMDIYIIINVG